MCENFTRDGSSRKRSLCLWNPNVLPGGHDWKSKLERRRFCLCAWGEGGVSGGCVLESCRKFCLVNRDTVYVLCWAQNLRKNPYQSLEMQWDSQRRVTHGSHRCLSMRVHGQMRVWFQVYPRIIFPKKLYSSSCHSKPVDWQDGLSSVEHTSRYFEYSEFFFFSSKQ